MATRVLGPKRAAMLGPTQGAWLCCGLQGAPVPVEKCPFDLGASHSAPTRPWQHAESRPLFPNMSSAHTWPPSLWVTKGLKCDSFRMRCSSHTGARGWCGGARGPWRASCWASSCLPSVLKHFSRRRPRSWTAEHPRIALEQGLPACSSRVRLCLMWQRQASPGANFIGRMLQVARASL